MSARRLLAALSPQHLLRRQGFWRGRGGVVLGLTAFLACFLIGLTGLEIVRRHDIVMADYEHRTQNLSELAAAHLARTLESIDRSLQDSARLSKLVLTGQRPAGEDVFDDMASIYGSASAVTSITFYDREGERILSAGSVTAGTDISQRESFLVHAGDGGSRQMHISHPFVSTVTQRHTVLASRRVSADDGSFLGIVAARLDLDYFSRLYASLALGETGSFSIVFDDGILMIRTPSEEGLTGKPVAPTAIFATVLAQGRAGTAHVRSTYDGQKRLLSYRRVPRSALVVGVSYTTAEILQSWRRNSIIASGIILVTAGAILLGGILLARSLYRGEQRERMLIAARMEAEEASRAKSEFLAIMSHELRTPMNGVIGYSKLLAGLDLTEKARGYAAIISDSASGLLGIVNDILDYSKMEAGKITLESVETDLRRLVNDVILLNRPAADAKGLDLRLRFDDRAPACVLADPTRLRQVLINLVGNAVKFTSEGHVTLSVSVEASDKARSSLRFAVTDTGMGIREADMPLLFQSFTQVDSTVGRRFGGTGLGLTICKRLVEMMGGSIGVSSQFEVGSTFWFTLLFTEVTTKAESGAAAAEPPLRTGKILVVDDNRTNRRLVSALLAPTGNTVVDAASGAEALQKLAAEDFDLILMDLNMPVMDGLEATVRIRALPEPKCSTPVVALTASAMGDEITRCRNAGMNGHVAKPIDAATLLQAISANIRKAA